MKVLVISFFYPPFNSVGAVRVSKFTKYLPQYGWTPHVLTVDQDDLPSTLEVEIPVDSIHRVRQFDINGFPKVWLKRKTVSQSGYITSAGLMKPVVEMFGRAYRQLVNFPDGQIGWYPYAVRAGAEIIKTEKPDALLSSSLPATSHLIAYRLSGASGLPWIADLRDPWTENQNFKRVQPLRALERILETRVLGQASALVTVTEPWAARLRERFQKPVYVIPNGFDSSDYAEHDEPTRNFTLTYTGMIYSRKQDVTPLFVALDSLAKSGALPDDFCLRFVGRYLDHAQAQAKKMGLERWVKVMPPVSHREAARLQSESTALLLLLGKDAENAGWCPAKFFEYLGARRPILALGPLDNIAAQLIARANAGTVAQTAEQIESVMMQWFSDFRQTGSLPVRLNDGVIRAFERRALTRQLAQVLENVCAEKSKVLEGKSQ